MDRLVSDNDRPRHDKDTKAICTKELSKTDTTIPHSRDSCAQNLAILIGGYMKCICGLSFMEVDWLHHRKRGYCSYKCRLKYVMKKRLNK